MSFQLILDVGLSDLLADIPRDAGAIILYAVVLLFGYFVWHGSRTSGHKDRRIHDSEDAERLVESVDDPDGEVR